MTDQPHEVLATLKDTVANPAPLGLMAFGVTTVLLNLQNAGLFKINAMIWPWPSSTAGWPRSSPVCRSTRRATRSGRRRSVLSACSGVVRRHVRLPQVEGMPAASARPPWAGICSRGVCSPALMFVATLRINRSLQVGVRQPHDAVRAARDRQVDGQHHARQGRRLGRHLRRPIGGLRPIAQICNEVYGRVILPIEVKDMA